MYTSIVVQCIVHCILYVYSASRKHSALCPPLLLLLQVWQPRLHRLITLFSDHLEYLDHHHYLLGFCLFQVCMSATPFAYLSGYPSSICLSFCLFVCLSVCLFICLPVHLADCPFACLFFCLSVLLHVIPLSCLSFYLPVLFPVCLSFCLSFSVCTSPCLLICLASRWARGVGWAILSVCHVCNLLSLITITLRHALLKYGKLQNWCFGHLSTSHISPVCPKDTQQMPQNTDCNFRFRHTPQCIFYASVLQYFTLFCLDSMCFSACYQKLVIKSVTCFFWKAYIVCTGP